MQAAVLQEKILPSESPVTVSQHFHFHRQLENAERADNKIKNTETPLGCIKYTTRFNRKRRKQYFYEIKERCTLKHLMPIKRLS